jgi:hypothetical protein
MTAPTVPLDCIDGAEFKPVAPSRHGTSPDTAIQCAPTRSIL